MDDIVVNDLDDKLTFLAKKHDGTENRSALATFTKINLNAVRRNSHNGVMSLENQEKLAIAFGCKKFHPGWRTCSAIEFEENFEKMCVGQEQDNERPVSADDSLVTVEMFLEQSNKDSTLVFIELRCRDAVLGTDELTQSRRIAIQRGVLRLDCGANGHAASKMSEGGRERADWFAKSGKFILETRENSKVTIRGTGSSREMIWSIEANSGHYLDNVELNEPHSHVVDLLEDDKLTATFETFPKNMAFVLIEEETGKQEVLTRNQQAIVDHMEKQALCQGQQKGSAVFSRHSRIFKGIATRK